MIRGIYFSARGMLAEQQRLDMASNNLANAQTPGFRREYPVFASSGEMGIWRVNDGSTFPPVMRCSTSVPIGRMATGSRLAGSLTDHEQAALLETGNPLDLALEGPGYFVLDTPNGARYTRNGSFSLDREGCLVTSQGYRVMGESGPLQLGTQDVSIDREGNIRDGENTMGRLRILEFEEENALVREGDSLFRQTTASGVETRDTQVHQGYLEASNVNPLKELVDVITIMRAYESNQKAIQAQDETLGKAIDQVAKM